MSREQKSAADTAIEQAKALDLISTLPELLTQHLHKRPDAVAYKYYSNEEQAWKDLTFKNVFDTVHEWRHAWSALDFLVPGDRVAMLLPNCPEAVFFDQSALANTLVPVPLHAIDTPNSSAFIMNDAGTKVLVTNKLLKWKQIHAAAELPELRLVVITDEAVEPMDNDGVRVVDLATFLEEGRGSVLPETGPGPEDLAALVYTSGTTGNPKGVMLTHRNVLCNIQGVLQNLMPAKHETMLSFLPLSHTFERTTTYYLSLALGYTVAFNRSIANLQNDFKTIRPTVLMSVPRVYEMIYAKIRDGLAKKSPVVRHMFAWAVEVGWRRFCRENGLPVETSWREFLDPVVSDFLDRKVGKQLRDVFGDRIHLYISGGAALNPTVSKTFLALGIPIHQGYGMTETSPIIAVNCVGHNHPSTVGPALKNIEVRLDENDELQVRGPTVMQGYWKNEEATRAIFTEDGWLRTGDVCRIYPDGNIRITGRLKEIIVTSTGEKIPPSDLEAAVQNDELFAQVMAVGENRPFISVVCVVNPERWKDLCNELGLDPADPASLKASAAKRAALRRIKAAAKDFPNYGVPRQVCLVDEPWTIDNGMLTPTLKMKRRVISQKYAAEIRELYSFLEKRSVPAD